MSKPTSDDSLMLEIDIDAPPERIFALTEPKELIAWWGEEAESHTTSWELDLRVGGQWRSRRGQVVWRMDDLGRNHRARSAASSGVHLARASRVSRQRQRFRRVL